MADAELRALGIYGALLASIGRRAADIEPRPLASQWPHVGTAYRGLAVAGQSLQGWDRAVTGARWQASDATSEDGRRRIIESSRTWHKDHQEPIAPIVELPNRRNSPFWRLCADLVALLEPDGPEPWYSRFAWANVYPVGPDYTPTQGAGSPTGPLKEAQDPYVGDLLRQSITMLAARRVVIVAGPQYWWHPARGAFASLLPRTSPLIPAGSLDGRAWVVGYHPGFARRLGYGAAAYAQLLVDALHEIEGGDSRLPNVAVDLGLRSPEMDSESTERDEGVDKLELRFDRAMMEIYERAGHEEKYWATRYLQMLRRVGGLATARRLLKSPITSDGYAKLRDANRLDLTVEALVQQPEWAPLFSAEELQRARDRYAQYQAMPTPSELEPSAELTALVARANDAPASTRIKYRDEIAPHGPAAIVAVRRSLNEGGSVGLAIGVIEVVGRAHPDQAVSALWAIRGTFPNWEGVIDPAIKRIRAERPT